MLNKTYPKINIRSKCELSKRISHKKLPRQDALTLINDVKNNFEKYWKDNISKSKPEKNKYVRNAKRTPLGKLLKIINSKILAPHDNIVPNFIFGGPKGRDHVKAAYSLLGTYKKRTLLKADLQGFFEQIDEKNVIDFFLKCDCDYKTAKFLGYICCVFDGQKGSNSKKRVLARGFSTSSRLAVWCNLDVFIELDRLVKKRLKGYDPRLAIFVDDIGITASRVPIDLMDNLYKEIKELFEGKKQKQPLILNDKKKDIKQHFEGMEILGSFLYRNKLKLGKKSFSNKQKIKSLLKEKNVTNMKKIKNKYRSIKQYEKYVEMQGKQKNKIL
ncbi:MAG: hypothetical protein COX80_01055 [Candidatus Magasanikbacteria bacterium CG_4_10_14_0_2_um_filter_33_14]|uniref:Uncharacterized protein n=1 Tax=Candidatus Magasanikbacteria bacterium CG_4_10_14_0_2_um_filter_33_14 TaxID=1974636 RepID=A0A2M7VBN9_9BACT|nr:MAG: hypothetical protein COX80_01055 [Candidatus Magasanikbacteria bacterium CG_4_10_14_0_2_um_filter_33_14]